MRTLLVMGDKTFKIVIPDDAKITFGPWSPPKKGGNAFEERNTHAGGTLRIYDNDKNVIALFCQVTSYRDLSLQYSEQVAKEEGATIWKSDHNGYEREDKRQAKKEWIDPLSPKLLKGTKR